MSTIVVDPKDAKILVNGLEIDNVEIDLCECGQESYYAGHGFRNGKLYSEYHCKECFHRRNK